MFETVSQTSFRDTTTVRCSLTSGCDIAPGTNALTNGETV